MTIDKNLDKFVQEQLIKNKMIELYQGLSDYLGSDTDWSKIVDIAYKEYETVIEIMMSLYNDLDVDDVFKITKEKPVLEAFIYLLLLKTATMDIIIAKFIKG